MVAPLARGRSKVRRATAPVPDIDPIEELDGIVDEAQERDADDERRLDNFARSDRPSSYDRRRPDRR